MSRVAVVGNLSLDVVDGGEPRVGGGAYYCGRALAAVGADAVIATACAAEHRALLVEPLEALGLPVHWRAADTTATFVISNNGDTRELVVERLSPAWAPADVEAIDAEWVHVAGLSRSDFPAETLAALAVGRRLSLDAQGLVRVPGLGVQRHDGAFDAALLAHVSVLKVSEEEIEAVAGTTPLDALGIPEVVLTRGSRGCVVIAGGATVEVPAVPVDGDPTGAGDMFSAAYVAARAVGRESVDAAREATALVARLLVP